MAGSVIDSLVVTLGLDSKAFATGIKGSTEQMATFTRRLAGMFLAVRGVEDVVGYFKDLHHQLAEVGFQSRNLGVMGTELKRLGEVSELFGGQMQDATDSIEGLQSAIFGLKYKGQMSESLMMLQRFGVAYLDAAGHMRSFRDIARDAAAAIDRQAKITGMDQGERYQMALSMGFTGGIASAVAQGGKGLESALEKSKIDQRALTEKTIRGQVDLARQITRLQEVTAANSSALLQSMMPAIIRATEQLRKLAETVLPWLAQKLDEVIAFLKHPPPWLEGLEKHIGQLAGILGPGGPLILALAGLTAAVGVGGALVSGIASLGTILAPLALTVAAGVGLGTLLDKIPAIEHLGEKVGSWLYDLINPNAGANATAPSIIHRPPTAPPLIALPMIPTPGAARPAAPETRPSGAGAPPLAQNGGGSVTSVQIDSMTIHTRATDANGIAADMGAAMRRKLLVSSADAGVA